MPFNWEALAKLGGDMASMSGPGGQQFAQGLQKFRDWRKSRQQSLGPSGTGRPLPTPKAVGGPAPTPAAPTPPGPTAPTGPMSPDFSWGKLGGARGPYNGLPKFF